MKITWSAKLLVVTLLFRLLFGGYLIGMDQYRYDDVGSAFTVLFIYGLIGIFAALFLFGHRFGLLGLIGLDVVFLLMQSVFTILALGQIVDPGLHGPLDNWEATLLMLAFSLLSIIFAVRAYRETKFSHTQVSESAINP